MAVGRPGFKIREKGRKEEIKIKEVGEQEKRREKEKRNKYTVKEVVK